jgi:hypothetical protein
MPFCWTNDLPASASFSACKILNVFSEYASGFFEPAASHPPATPSPRHEGLLGQAPSDECPERSGKHFCRDMRAA